LTEKCKETIKTDSQTHKRTQLKTTAPVAAPVETSAHDNRACTFRDIAAKVANEQTKAPTTNKHDGSQYLPAEVIRSAQQLHCASKNSGPL